MFADFSFVLISLSAFTSNILLLPLQSPLIIIGTSVAYDKYVHYRKLSRGRLAYFCPVVISL
jgi:hypothetical protein